VINRGWGMDRSSREPASPTLVVVFEDAGGLGFAAPVLGSLTRNVERFDPEGLAAPDCCHCPVTLRLGVLVNAYGLMGPEFRYGVIPPGPP